ncbi:amidohydrolase family protein [Ideonella livida]|uniref:Amidohydrolase family protein n=1 Tax=Ideonella livida TaxID=2707176 RepID=A0A7C9THF0_9BURK|nr:amidohydrolase family protein [Ideonella livida]NDY90440.1 amidohydrolase family protein [Ideonella livida]
MKRCILAARLVTMGPAGVLATGHLYLKGDRIVAAQDATVPPPPGFAGVTVHDLSGYDVLPGLMDLHNHPAYNALPLWPVPKRYTGRSQWLDDKRYRAQVSAPATALLKAPSPYLRALARYVELRSLMGGCTALQGLSAKGGSTHYRGLVRNFEETSNGGLPRARTRVADVDSDDELKSFAEVLDSQQPTFFHWAEGTAENPSAVRQVSVVREHQLLRPNLICIHCLALTRDDHQALRDAGSHVVWSPLSNLLLYGKTLDPADLNTHHPFALGCDWTPSGSRNLLQELKVAHLVDQQQEVDQRLGTERLVKALTADAARVVQWGGQLGQLRAGYLADLLVVRRRHDDPYANLLHATEREVAAVWVDGVPLYGDADLMLQLSAADTPIWPHWDTLTVGGVPKRLRLPDAGPNVSACMALLSQALAHPEALAPSAAPGLAPAGADWAASAAPVGPAAFGLVFDMGDDLASPPQAEPAADQPGGMAMAWAPAHPTPIKPLTLAPLTVVDDPDYCTTIAQSPNLPDYLRGDALKRFYLAPQ